MDQIEWQLVDRCRQGDREAFGQIVQQYQNLICSLAYGATGSLSLSEELAQDTFLVAWRSIQQLHHPERLRSWLCGILRNLLRDSARRRRRDVLHRSRAVLTDDAVSDAHDDPAAASLQREEVTLLNQTLEKVPPIYREPLVLYYRNEESVGRVAEILGLSTDAVKQRLARGRKLLRHELAAIVETGLRQTAPGRAFTFGVLAALPVMSGTAKAATVSAAGAKGITAMNAISWTGMILGPLAGIAGAWFGVRMSLRSATSEQERTLLIRAAWCMTGLVITFCLGLTLVTLQTERLVKTSPVLYATLVIGLTVGYVVLLIGGIMVTNRKVARLRRQQRQATSLAGTQPPAVSGASRWPRSLNYESPRRLLGLPLISIRLTHEETDNQPKRAAIGWIAIGNRAYGAVAVGTFAVGGISTGAVGIGLLSFAGLAMGLVSLGGAALGGMATGGFAVGLWAFGGCALAWQIALGGLAISRYAALGGLALAPQANTELAVKAVADNPFFRLADILANHSWIWLVLVAGSLLPVYWAYRFVEKRAAAVESLDDGNEHEPGSAQETR